jgi:asparagine synthase (glutamine-hydrolysing)
VNGIAGVFHRDGRTVDPACFGRMLSAAAYRFPRGTRFRIEQGLALSSPVLDSRRDLAIAFHGRLDDRSGLIGRLGPDWRAHGVSDEALVLDAYARWGERCPIHLLGDFAFAIWDGRHRRLFCARDIMGMKPFFYLLDPRTFAFGSDVRQLLASGYVSPEPNEGLVGEYLARKICSHHETLFRNILRLPAAHAMSIDAADARMVRYWRLDPAAELRHATDAEYAEQCQTLFRESVACRLRGSGPIVASYLSGGIDSSSVVGMTAALGHPLETFSLVFPDNPLADESGYIDDVVGKWSLTAHKLVAPRYDGARCRTLVDERADVPDLPPDLVAECLLARIRDRSLHVTLTGVGGDYLFGGSLYHYAELLKKGALVALARQFLSDARMSDVGWSPSQLFLSGIRPLLPGALKHAVRPLARRLGWVPPVAPPWIAPALSRRVGLEDRLRAGRPRSAGVSTGRGEVLAMLESGWPSRIHECVERAGVEHGVDHRHPFFDRRLVEFAVALPEAQRWQGEQTKFVLRQAVRAWLPDSVYQRKTKGDFTDIVPEALAAIGGKDLLDHLHIASSCGWVRQPAVSAAYRHALRLFERREDEAAGLVNDLWMMAGVELWYRSVFVEGGSHARAGRTESCDGGQHHYQLAGPAA